MGDPVWGLIDRMPEEFTFRELVDVAPNATRFGLIMEIERHVRLGKLRRVVIDRQMVFRKIRESE